MGKQNPDQCKINIAIPSLTERKKDSTDMSNFKTVPGFIDSCLDLLQTSGIIEVNLAIDEKSLSPGVRLVEPDVDKNENMFYVEGDVDYAIPSINKNKEDLLYNLNHWHKISPSSSFRDSFLCISSLYNQLHQAKIRIEKSLKVLKSKSRINSISISRESANISIINSSIRDVLDLKGKFIKHSLLNKTKFPTVQEDVNLELETSFDQSINQSINQSGQKILKISTDWQGSVH